MGLIGALVVAGVAIYSVLVATLWGARGARLRWILVLVGTIAVCLVLRGSAEVFGWPPSDVTAVVALSLADLAGLGFFVALRRRAP
jgi:hypothetical protein